MSYTLSAQIIGDKELKEVFENSPKVVAKHIGDAIEKVARSTEATAKKLAPWQYGDLRRSIDTQGPVITHNNIFAKVGTDKLYGRYQEEGTGIEGPKKQMITPKTKEALRWKSAGKWIFAKAVKGVKPKWYMKQAREAAKPLMTDFMRLAIAKIVGYLATGK